MGYGGRQLDPLALAGGHGADSAEAFFAQTNLPQGIAGPFGGRSLWQAVQLGEMANEVIGLYVRWEVVVFGRIPNATAYERSVGLWVDTQDGHVAAASVVKAEHEAHERGLASTV